MKKKNTKETVFLFSAILLCFFFIQLIILKNYKIWDLLLVPIGDVPYHDFSCLQDWTKLEKYFYTSSNFLYSRHTTCILSYPRIWILISSFFKLDINTNFILAISFFITIYFLIYLFYIKKFKSYFFLYFFFSGSSLLLIERGNSDIIIFILLTILFNINHNLVKYFLFIITSFLKLYPFFSILFFFKTEKFLKIIILVLFVFFYFLIFKEDIILSIANTPKTGYLSYGSWVIYANLAKYFNINLHYFIISILISLFSIFFYVIFFKKFFKKNIVKIDNSFYIGTGIFISTFLLSSNFDYRLVFLFFLIPTIIKIQNQCIKFIYQTLIILSCEFYRLGEFFGIYGKFINQLSKTVLLILVINLLCYSIEKKLLKLIKYEK
jgi:hypothetical protein